MSWLKKILSTLNPSRRQKNSISEKALEELYNDPGVFQYDEDGFTITYEDFTKSLRWDDITQLNVYKKDLLTIDRVDMEIVYGDLAFSISEELPGWYQFVIKTKEVFPDIPGDWDSVIITPAFATNYRTIYDRPQLPVTV